MKDLDLYLNAFFEMDNETIFYATGVDTREASDESGERVAIIIGVKYDDGDIYSAWAYPEQLRWAPSYIEPHVRAALKDAAK